MRASWAVSLLNRRCIGECLRQMLFFLLAYLALISIAVTAPLIRGGAPLGAVIGFLPDQMALPATLALPLALVTAILVTLGRMRESGELIALQAAGVSTLKVVLALLPPVVVTALLVGLMAHAVLPGSFQRWREGKSALLRQAVATKVAQRTFIYHDDRGTALAADDVDGDRLLGLFARHQTEDGGTTMLFAPEARWVARSDERRDSLTLQLQFQDARVLGRRPAGEEETITAGDFPSLVLQLEQPNPIWATKADTMPTDLLAANIAAYGRALDQAKRGAPAALIIAEALEAEPPSLDQGQIGSWSRFIAQLRDRRSSPVLRTLHAAVSDLVDGAATGTESERTRLMTRLDASLPSTMRDPAVRGSLPPLLQDIAVSADERVARHLARFALSRATDGNLVPDPTSGVLHRTTHQPGHDANSRRQQILDFQKDLRTYQMAWHLRWMMATLPLAYWVFAAGLALGRTASNRLLAICIALTMVLATLLPGVALAKNSDGHLGFNPAWIMWGGWLALAATGCWLCWRRR